MSGSGSGLMSSNTISASFSERVFAMSLSSDGDHWLLPPPMMTMRGAIAFPPFSSVGAGPALDLQPQWHADGLLRFFHEMRDQPGRTRDEYDAARARRGEPEVDERGAARTRAVDREVLAAPFLVHRGHLLEQSQVRSEQPFRGRDRV